MNEYLQNKMKETLMQYNVSKEKTDKMFETIMALGTTDADSSGNFFKAIEPVIVEMVKFLSPLLANIAMEKAMGLTHPFLRETAQPAANWLGEKGDAATGNGTYTPDSVTLKSLKSNIFGTSGLLRAVSPAEVDFAMTEFLGAVNGLKRMLEVTILYGNATDQTYAPSGYNALITTNTALANAKISDTMLTWIWAKTIRGGADVMRNRMMLMSPELLPIAAALYSPTKSFVNTPSIEVAGGWKLKTILEIPVYPTTFTQANTASSVGTVTGTSAAVTGGALVPAQTYYYKVASITLAGPQIASAASAQVTIGGGHNAVNVAWTADANAIAYIIYRTDTGAASSTIFYYVGIADAFTYSGGAITGTNAAYVDKKADASKDSYQSAKANGDEDIFMLDFDSKQASRLVAGYDPKTRRELENYINFYELSASSDVDKNMLTWNGALEVKNEKRQAVYHNVRQA